MQIGRVIVVFGVLVGVAFVYLLAANDADLWDAFVRAIVAAVLTMIALGVGERFWRGKKVTGADVSPTGGGVSFDDEIATASAQLNESLNEHVAMINKRLYELERAVFGRERDE
jgi:hypothetical protein